MRKWLMVITLILISSLGVACGKDPSISYAKSKIQINFDETYTIDEDDIKITDSKNDYIITILNTDIAELDGLTIIPKNKGETYIRFSIEDEDKFIDIPLAVTHIIYATTASIEQNNVVININDNQKIYNKITLNDGCNEVPQISFDRNVVSYNYITGEIVPVATGNTTVLVLYNSCNISFSVIIIDKVYTNAIEVENHIVYQGDSGEFEYSIFPSLANTYRFYSFSDKLQVLENGQYTAVEVGEVDVYVEYYTDESTPVVKSFKVKIIEEVKSFDFEIVNIDGTEAKYYLKEKSYKITLLSIRNVTQEDVTISSNFVVDSFEIKDNCIDILGGFNGVGEQIITIQIVSNGNTIQQSNNFNIYQISDIEIVAKWSAYNQLPYNDGKYHIKLQETTNYPSYLRFYLSVNGVIISDSFKIFDITSSKLEIATTFTPTTTGEFILSFEFMESNIGEIIVVVE